VENHANQRLPASLQSAAAAARDVSASRLPGCCGLVRHGPRNGMDSARKLFSGSPASPQTICSTHLDEECSLAMVLPSGALSPVWRPSRLSPPPSFAAQELAGRLLLNQGITPLRLLADEEGNERILPLRASAAVMTGAEWRPHRARPQEAHHSPQPVSRDVYSEGHFSRTACSAEVVHSCPPVHAPDARFAGAAQCRYRP